MGKTFETNRGAWKLGVAALGMALVAGGCADGDAGTGGGGPDVVASALITAPGEAGTATVRITGATDWQGQGRAPLALNVLIDGEPAGWVIGEPALIASEGSGLGFGIAAGTMTVDLATADGQVVWSFGAQTLAANRVSDLLYWGSADDPRVMRLDDPGAELPEGQGMARLINLDDRHEPVSALLCPADAEDFDGCEVVAEDLAYGESWTGQVATDPPQVLRWEREAPADYAWGRFIGGGAVPIGATVCPNGEEVRTHTLIPVHVVTPAEQPDCAYCTSGWSFGDGTSPGDCAW